MKYISVILHISTSLVCIWLIALACLEDIGVLDMNKDYKMLAAPVLLFDASLVVICFLDVYWSEDKRIIIILTNVPMVLLCLCLCLVIMTGLVMSAISLVKIIMLICVTLYIGLALSVYIIRVNDFTNVTNYLNKYVSKPSRTILDHLFIELARVYTLLVLMVSVVRHDFNTAMFPLIGILALIFMVVITNKCVCKVLNVLVSVPCIVIFGYFLDVKDDKLTFTTEPFLLRLLYPLLGFILLCNTLEVIKACRLFCKGKYIIDKEKNSEALMPSIDDIEYFEGLKTKWPKNSKLKEDPRISERINLNI